MLRLFFVDAVGELLVGLLLLGCLTREGSADAHGRHQGIIPLHESGGVGVAIACDRSRGWWAEATLRRIDGWSSVACLLAGWLVGGHSSLGGVE